MPITTNVVCSNPAHGEVYSIQLYVIKFVSNLRQVGGFLRVFRFPSQIKLTATKYLKLDDSGVKHQFTHLHLMSLKSPVTDR
jgi:hypothetical protein